MAGAELGTATGRIDIDATGLRRLEATLMQAGRGLLYFGGATGAAFVKIVSTAATFEESMSKISAISDATGADLDKLRGLAIKMGQETAFGAIEAANSFETLAKAGFSVQEIMDGVGAATLNLAAAGDISLDQSADLMASAIRTFGLGADESSRVADVIAAAANESQIDVSDFANTLKYAGGAAAAQGVPIEDLSAIIATMGEKGIKASQAGTALRTMFTSMAAPTKKAAELMADLGITTDGGAKSLYDLNGTAKPLGAQLKIIDDATKGLGDQQRTQAFKTIFGQRALSAMLLVLQDGTTDYERFREAMAGGDAEAVAAEKLDNLAGAWKKFKASIETLFITSGSPLQKSLQGIVEFATSVVNAFSDLPKSVQTAIPIILAVISVVSLFSGAWLLTIGTMLRAIRTLSELRAGLAIARGAVAGFFRAITAGGVAALANPFVLVVAAVLALGAALVWLYFHSEGFRKFVDGLWQDAQRVFNKMKSGWDEIKRIFSGDPREGPSEEEANVNYDETIEKIRKREEELRKWNKAVEEAKKGGKDLGNIDSGAINDKLTPPSTKGPKSDPNVNFYDKDATTTEKAFKRAGDSIKNFKDENGKILDKIKSKLMGFIFSLKLLPEVVSNFFQGVGGKVATGFTSVITSLKGWVVDIGFQVADIPRKIGNFFSSLPQVIGTKLGETLGRVTTWAGELPSRASEAATRFKDNISLGFNQMKTTVVTKLAEVRTAIVTWVTDSIASAGNMGYGFMSSVGNWISQLPGRIQGWMSEAWNQIQFYGSLLISSITNTATGIYNSVVDWVGKVPGRIKGFFDRAVIEVSLAASNIYNKALQVGKNIYNGIVGGIGDIVGWIKDKINGIISAIGGAARQVGDAAGRFGASIWDGFKNALFGSPHTKVEYALWDMEANAQKSVEGLDATLKKVSEISRGMGTFETTVIPLQPQQLSPAQMAAKSTSLPPPAAAGLIVQGPLLAVDTMEVRNDSDILKVSRSLADLVEREQAAKGRKVVGVNA